MAASREEYDDGDEVREQDRFLPIANISRIMKKALPTNAKIAKDAKETVQECVSEFISFITSEGARRAVMSHTPRVLNRNGYDLWEIAAECSKRQVPARETQDDQRRRLVVGHDHARLRELPGAAQDLLVQVSRSMYACAPEAVSPAIQVDCRGLCGTWWRCLQSVKGDKPDKRGKAKDAEEEEDD